MSDLESKALEYRKAVQNLKRFEKSNEDLMTVYKNIQKSVEDAETVLKNDLKVVVKEYGDLNRVIEGVSINSFVTHKRIFDLSNFGRLQLEQLLNLNLLDVRLGVYNAMIKDESLPKDIVCHKDEFGHVTTKLKVEE